MFRTFSFTFECDFVALSGCGSASRRCSGTCCEREILVPHDLRPLVLGRWGSGVLNILQWLGQFTQRILSSQMPVVSPSRHTVSGSWDPSRSGLRLLQGGPSQTVGWWIRSARGCFIWPVFKSQERRHSTSDYWLFFRNKLCPCPLSPDSGKELEQNWWVVPAPIHAPQFRCLPGSCSQMILTCLNPVFLFSGQVNYLLEPACSLD